MLYVLYSQEYEDVNFHGVFEAPDGINISDIQSKFRSTFGSTYIGSYKAPEYKGPMTKYKKTKGTNSCGSELIPEMEDGDLIPDIDIHSVEYEEWEKACAKYRKDYHKKIEDRFKEIQALYPGKTEEEMFISYLKQEFNFKEVENRISSI